MYSLFSFAMVSVHFTMASGDRLQMPKLESFCGRTVLSLTKQLHKIRGWPPLYKPGTINSEMVLLDLTAVTLTLQLREARSPYRHSSPWTPLRASCNPCVWMESMPFVVSRAAKMQEGLR